MKFEKQIKASFKSTTMDTEAPVLLYTSCQEQLQVLQSSNSRTCLGKTHHSK